MTELLRVVEPDHSKRTARFGTFEVDLQTRELRRAGKEVRIQVQPFRILALLLERAGEIVTREELRERLWPEDFVDFDHSLNAAVRKLREALGDSAENPRFVETLARRGYRFIAPVSWAEEQTERKDWRPAIAVAALIAVVVVAAVVFWLRRHPAATAAPIHSVAVLPFTNDEPQTQVFSDGLTEILIDRLSRLPDLRVMARTTVFTYKGKDARQAGEALHVGGIVTGHVRRAGDRYEIHVELMDVKDGTQLWGERFDATSATLPEAQAQISDALTTELRQGISRDERAVVASGYTRDPQAYEAYLWGLYAWNKRDAASLKNAINYFNQAIARDPNFGAAYAGIANTYGVMVGFGAIPVGDGTQKVLTNARKALALDPNNAEALVAIATTKYRNLWDFAGADADYRRAFAINPNYATGHEWYSGYLRDMGRWGEADREIKLARELDPSSWAIRAMYCFHLYYHRRYADAIATGNDRKFEHPQCLAHTLMMVGRIGETIAILDQVGVSPDTRAAIAEAFRRGGAQAFFRKSAESLASQQSQQIDTPVQIAAFFAMAGDKDRAFAWLERGYKERVSAMTDINIEPMLDSLRSDPRYDDLLRRIGLPKTSPPS